MMISCDSCGIYYPYEDADSTLCTLCAAGDLHTCCVCKATVQSSVPREVCYDQKCRQEYYFWMGKVGAAS